MLGFTTPPQPGKPYQAAPKSVIVILLNHHPAPRDLYLTLRDRQAGSPGPDQPQRRPVEPAAAPPSAPAAVPPPPTAPTQQPLASPSKEAPPPLAPEERSPTVTVFAVVSPTFARPAPRPVEQVLPPALPPPTPPSGQKLVGPPAVPARPDHNTAYQPVHAAWVALLQAIETLSAQYGREWLQWEQAQADLARLRAAVMPSEGRA